MKKLFLIVGESGSGKTTVVNELIKRGYKSINSYTTRPPRHENETGHIFIDIPTYKKFKDANEIVAYTFFNKAHYFAIKQQLLENDLYVIDPNGVEYLKEKVKDIEFVTIYIKIDKQERIRRMYNRGDTKDQIIERMINDVDKFKKIDFDYAIPNNDVIESANIIEYIMKGCCNVHI